VDPHLPNSKGVKNIRKKTSYNPNFRGTDVKIEMEEGIKTITTTTTTTTIRPVDNSLLFHFLVTSFVLSS